MLSNLVLHEGFRLGYGLCVGLGLLGLRFGFVRGLDRLDAGALGGSLRLVCSVLRGLRVGSGLDGLSLSGLSLAFCLNSLS